MTIDRSGKRVRTMALAAALVAQLVWVPMLAHAYDAAPAAATAASVVTVPKSFSAYGSTPFNGGECVAGAVTKEGMNGRATVYVDDPTSHQVKWIKSIPLPPRRYQNRATHCVAIGDSLFVLVQTDMHQQTSLNQTLLSVVELSATDGTIKTTRDEELPGVEDAYSAWVDKGTEGFHEVSGQLKISGQYFLMNDANKRIPFTMSVPAHESH
ncbi:MULTISPECIES: hypothetical protein [Rhodanobacteraceae]|uniref:hypothetical protein n=1 Tax=Rhodanobacteraceae TaxID=1775411 RepID=UPI00087FE808|nr:MULTISPECIES: hypothetical protein [Rhodanobacteraceae]SDG73045.1 hypothetical protein SAMN04515659_3368 [Dyella sp. 333MFSha]SKB45232.1 hypothetical protein SAMN05660880_01165 [Luteibacter sp. 22Crub2.1]